MEAFVVEPGEELDDREPSWERVRETRSRISSVLKLST
jgi:hypothetical protein